MSRDDAESLYHDLVVAALSNGELAAAEERMLERLGEALGLEERRRRTVTAQVIAGDRRLRCLTSPDRRAEALAWLQGVLLADGALDPVEWALVERVVSGGPAGAGGDRAG